ncbi:GntR family transcriptional regulator [Trueperella pyogenes]
MTTLGVDTLCRTLSGWNNLASSVGQSLEEAFIHAIEAGFIPTGSTLPPQRELSKSLAVGRGTLQAALKNLENRGYLEIV